MGGIIRSRAASMEKKVINIFQTFENHRKSKSCIRNVYTEDGCLTSDPKRIMKEVESSYSKLYQEDNLKPSENELNCFLQSQGIC